MFYVGKTKQITYQLANMGDEELLGCSCGTRDEKVYPWSTPVTAW